MSHDHYESIETRGFLPVYMTLEQALVVSPIVPDRTMKALGTPSKFIQIFTILSKHKTETTIRVELLAILSCILCLKFKEKFKY